MQPSSRGIRACHGPEPRIVRNEATGEQGLDHAAAVDRTGMTDVGAGSLAARTPRSTAPRAPPATGARAEACSESVRLVVHSLARIPAGSRRPIRGARARGVAKL